MDHVGLTRGEVKIVAYDATWSGLFLAEKKLLDGAIGQYVIRIEHVGSTSVPGLAAKPLIDMIASVPSLNDYERLVAPLQALGYEFMPERVFNDRVFFPKGPRSNRTHHLSIVQEGSEQWRQTLLFRDYLIAHADARQEYEQLKLHLAQQFPNDRARYTAAKDEFITHIVSLAK